jgi:hypothetical protein
MSDLGTAARCISQLEVFDMDMESTYWGDIGVKLDSCVIHQPEYCCMSGLAYIQRKIPGYKVGFPKIS